MESKMEEIAMLLIITFIIALAQGQTLNIADTGGKGKIGGFVAVNGIAIKDFVKGGYSFAYTSYGLNKRVDLYAGVTVITLVGQTQVAVSGGANVRLFTAKGVSVSSYSLLSTPLHRRQDACGLSLFQAAIVSRKFTGKERIIPFGGYSATVPLGERRGKLFTNSAVIHNFFGGVMFRIWNGLLFPEINYGRQTKTLGIGYAF